MPHQLTRLVARIGKSEAKNHIVQALFQQHYEIRTGNTFPAFGLLKISAELIFQYTIDPPDFLFLAQLNAIIRIFASSSLTVLAGRISATFPRAFI